MQEIFLGEAIKQRRLKMGLTQEQLCEGICEPITISRLENGRQTPSRNRITALLERLDMPADRYVALLSKHELEIESLHSQITALNVRFSHACADEKPAIREKALQLHEELDDLADKDDMISRQLILRSRVILGKENGAYTYEEQKAILLDAIHLTSHSFDLNEIERGLYTTDEIKIINQLALTYVYEDRHMDAIRIYDQLYKYIHKHFHNIPPTRAHLSMVSFNYAREMLAIGQYERAIEIAEAGRKICLDYGYYSSLAGLLSVMAESYHFLGDDAKSKDLYYQTYYLSKATGNEDGMEITRKEAKEYFALDFDR